MVKWLENVVEKIVENSAEQDVITCQCGISTTGIAHIGNFREPIITYLVAELLKKKGKKVRLVMSFDDFDRLKKVPFGMPAEYSKYIGMPTANIPHPNDPNASLAKYYETKIIKELKMLGINMEYIYQVDNYSSGKYLDIIKSTLKQKDEIYEIIKKYKTQELSEDDKKIFFPVKIYCSCCGKDSTTILNYSTDLETISYKCTCGHSENNKLDKVNIKLKFNVEWPARWNYESVDFEPCGKGHTEELGVLNVSREINSIIYKQKNPIIISYEFVNLKGNQGRMNKNSKNLITIEDLLRVMPKEMILYYFLINDPKKEMALSIEDDIPKIYDSFEKFMISDSKDDIKELLNIDYEEQISFSNLIKYLPIANFNIENLKKYITFDQNSHNVEKIQCATNWLKAYFKDKYWEFNSEINYNYYGSLDLNRKKALDNFVLLSKDYTSFSSWEDFFDNFKAKNHNIKQFYKDFYMMLFNKPTGMPVKLLFENYDIDSIMKLLPQEKKFYNTSNNDKVRIIHLSDLHFDINDNHDILTNRIEMLIRYLKIGNYDNYLVISGDIICFYNMKENFDLAYDYLNYLVNELHISKQKILICTGNHEMISYDRFLNYYFANYDVFIKDKLYYYCKFIESLCGYSIKESNDLYFLSNGLPFDVLTINTLIGIINSNKVFFQDSNIINDMLAKAKLDSEKFRFVLSHTPYKFNSDFFDSTNIPEYFKYNLCGHKHKDNIIYNSNGIIDLISGSSDGLIGSEYSCNLYELNDNILVKKLIYKPDLSDSIIGNLTK